eukprot:454873_1
MTAEVKCEAGTHCQIYCDAAGVHNHCSYTRIDASQALSLNLTCEKCIGSTILCPEQPHTNCDVSCSDYDDSCFDTRMITANNTYASLECLGASPCNDIYLSASFVKHISFKCENCMGIEAEIPSIFNSTTIECLSYIYPCEMLLSIPDENYEYLFANITCQGDSTKCGIYGGGIQLLCGSRLSYIGILPYGQPHCSDYNCCPITHQHIHCSDYDKYGNCSVNCGGQSVFCEYNDVCVPDSKFCASSYIYGANQITCFGYEACNNITIYSNESMTIFCDSGVSNIVDDEFCVNMNLYINNETSTDIICYGQSCENMTIYCSQVQELNVAHNSCGVCGNEICDTHMNIYCGSNYSKFSSFDGRNCSNELCCDEDIFSITNSYDECSGIDWDSPQNYYFVYSGFIIAGLLFFALIYMITGCINRWKSFKKIGSESIDYAPFKSPLFILNYIHFIDFMIHIIYIYILFSFIISFEQLNDYCESKYVYDGMDGTVTKGPYCNDDELCVSLCGTDFIGLCGGDFQICYYDNNLDSAYYALFGSYFAIAIILYMCHCWRSDKYDINDFGEESFASRICKYVAPVSIWKEQTLNNYYQIKFFDLKYLRSKEWIFQTLWFIAISILSVYTSLTTELYEYCPWFVLYPIIFSYLIVVQSLKVYYRNLSPYDEMKVIDFILLEYFGYDIGPIISIFLHSDGEDTIESRKDTMTRPLLDGRRHKKYSVN